MTSRKTRDIFGTTNDHKERAMEYLQNMQDVCLSGGAEGADLEWGNCAASLGHEVIHWSFGNHRSQALETQIIRLDDEQLNLGIPALKNAAKALGKSPPRKPMVSRLLLRDYYQVAWSESCYAVTTIRTDVPPGGTAWATTMFTQLHPDNHNLFIFDQGRDAWFQVAGDPWTQIHSPPQPKGIWAGIGSRDLKPNGKEAIGKLMSCLDSQST